MENSILKSFKKADDIMLNATKTLAHKRNFYELINNCKEAIKINNTLIERKDKFAIQWIERYKESYPEGR